MTLEYVPLLQVQRDLYRTGRRAGTAAAEPKPPVLTPPSVAPDTSAHRCTEYGRCGEPWYIQRMGHCHACGAELPRDLPIFRETECPRCSKPLKVCLNCTFYEKGLQWDCRESIPEPVREKDRANFCDYFRLREGPGDRPGGLTHKRAEQARDAFNQLFE